MPPLTPRLRGILLVTTAAVVFSFSGLLVRLIDASGWTVVFWRCVFLVAGVSLYLLWRYGSRLPAMLRAGAPLWAEGARVLGARDSASRKTPTGRTQLRDALGGEPVLASFDDVAIMLRIAEPILELRAALPPAPMLRSSGP